jgi:dihydroorotate dehydrogenase (NAD+) catalytic subunit
MPKTDLSLKLCGMRLPNPAILASGILGETAGSLIRIAKGGAGAVVTKSISVEPRAGYANPTVVETEHGLLNAMGLPNPGITEYRHEMQRAAKECGVPVIASIFGADAKEFAILAKKMEKYGASALELNLSCPHAKGYGAELGCDSSTVEQITKQVRESVKIPVFVKLTPNIASILQIARAVEKGGGDGVVAINTLRAMAIDTDMKRPLLANRIGGLSGPAIKPVGVRAVYELYGEISIPIIGCGGITTGKDAVEYMLAGASAVQIGSAVHYRGAGVFKKVCDEMKTYMKANKIKNIGELVGVAKVR